MHVQLKSNPYYFTKGAKDVLPLWNKQRALAPNRFRYKALFVTPA